MIEFQINQSVGFELNQWSTGGRATINPAQVCSVIRRWRTEYLERKGFAWRESYEVHYAVIYTSDGKEWPVMDDYDEACVKLGRDVIEREAT